jgi:Ca-activated chloride channel family protein
MFEFEWPWIFLLLPLPWLIKQLMAPVQLSRQSALEVPFINAVEYAQGRTGAATFAQSHWQFVLMFLVWCLLLAAAAKPLWVGDPILQQREGRDLMLAVDLSESMQERDFTLDDQVINRLLATKIVASDFIDRREGDRVGLILFGDEVYLQAPLTHDRETVKQLLSEAEIGLAGKATAIGDAIGLAIKRFKELGNEQRVLILITDGTNTAGALDPVKATELAVAENLKIYTIGIGRDKSQRGIFSRFVGTPELDERTLLYIAQQTGGQYFRATNLQQLAQIYQHLNQLEAIEQDDDYYRPKASLFQWPLLAAMLLWCLIVFVQWRLA